MSDSEVLSAAEAAWPAIGVTLSFVLGWRGHSGFSWFVLGTLLGPLAIALAISSEGVKPDAVTRPVDSVETDLHLVFSGPPLARSVRQALPVAAMDAVLAAGRTFGHVDVSYRSGVA